MRIAVYGGSFNPPHVGHAMVAAWLRWTGRAEEVWLVPAFDHAFDKSLAPFEVRLEACRRQAESLGPWCRVEPVERDLQGPSYTIRTLDILAARWPEHSFRWVLGADVLETLHLWKEWRRILEEYSPITVGRQGYPPVEGAPEFPAFSSTEVRERLQKGLPVDDLLMVSVREWVEANRAAFLS